MGMCLVFTVLCFLGANFVLVTVASGSELPTTLSLNSGKVSIKQCLEA